MGKKMRVDKLLSNVGVASRAELKKYCKQGLISVNGKVINNPGVQVDVENDEIIFDGEKVTYKEFIYLMLNIIIAIVFLVLNAVLGLLINVYFPKLDWSNPTVVVKQSAAVFIGLVVTFASIALPIAVFLLLKVENILMFLSFLAIIFLALLFITWNILMTKGVKQFKM